MKKFFSLNWLHFIFTFIICIGCLVKGFTTEDADTATLYFGVSYGMSLLNGIIYDTIEKE